jgi:hypothetical protein
MPRVSDLLYRFRPSGAPGAATQAGVPSDRVRDLAEELEPVFASLAQTQADCGRLVEEARAQAVRIRSRDAAEVERLLATAAPRAAAERARAAAAARAATGDDTTRLVVGTDEQLMRLRGRLEQMLPGFRAEVAGSIQALLDEGQVDETAVEVTR